MSRSIQCFGRVTTDITEEVLIDFGWGEHVWVPKKYLRTSEGLLVTSRDVRPGAEDDWVLPIWWLEAENLMERTGK